MKVLVVSHNAMDDATNMGKTIVSYFRDFAPEEIAQFYIHPGVPGKNSICSNFYQFTDKDAIWSLNPFRAYGKIYRETGMGQQESGQNGVTGRLYRFGTGRTAFIIAMRDLLWRCSRWDTPAFWKWVESFSPDIVFLMSGNYGFIYDVARKTAERLGKPLVISCVDDYYLCNRNAGSIAGKLVHRRFLKTVHKTISRSAGLFVISETMKDAYERLFGKPCRVLHTAASNCCAASAAAGNSVTYLGNLGLNRNKSLIELGRAMKAAGLGCIHVYSKEWNAQILEGLTPENGICFHGAVSAEEAQRIMASSLAVIHTESFDPQMQAVTRYSVSTKIADSLMNGPCILAYGPEGIASIDYVKENRAAYVISDPAELETELKGLLFNEALREEIVKNARALAKRNHDPGVNSVRLRRWLEALCAEWEQGK